MAARHVPSAVEVAPWLDEHRPAHDESQVPIAVHPRDGPTRRTRNGHRTDVQIPAILHCDTNTHRIAKRENQIQHEHMNTVSYA